MKLSESLKKQAQKLQASSTEGVAIQMLKQAGFSEEDAKIHVAQELMEKEAVNSLVDAGIDYNQALSLVKVANIKIKDLKEFDLREKTFEETMAETLLKTASEVETLEDKIAELDDIIGKTLELQEKVAELQSALDSQPEVTDLPEPITRFAKSGEFTNEDLQALMKLPSETLTKVAAVQEQPWKMGKAAGMSSEAAMDPLTAFLLS